MSQIDLPRGTQSGLRDALETLESVEGVATIRFGEDDVVRHPMVQRIVHAYNTRDKLRAATRGDGEAGVAAGAASGPTPDAAS